MKIVVTSFPELFEHFFNNWPRHSVKASTLARQAYAAHSNRLPGFVANIDLAGVTLHFTVFFHKLTCLALFWSQGDADTSPTSLSLIESPIITVNPPKIRKQTKVKQTLRRADWSRKHGSGHRNGLAIPDDTCCALSLATETRESWEAECTLCTKTQVVTPQPT